MEVYANWLSEDTARTGTILHMNLATSKCVGTALNPYKVWQSTATTSGSWVLPQDASFTLYLYRNDAHNFLSMTINRPPAPDPHEDGESFLDWTAKELAIKMTFDWDERESTKIFQGLKEPLASRLMHYLLKLRSVV